MSALRIGSTTLLMAMVGLLLAPPAVAGDDVDGAGYHLSLPDGFLSPSAEQAADVGVLPLTEGLLTRREPVRQVFVRPDAEGAPAAVLVAARIDLADSESMATTRHLQRYVLANLQRSPRHFERLLADGAITLTPSYRDGLEVLEMSHDGVRGPLGVEEPVLRALVVGGGDHLLVFALSAETPQEASLDATWQEVTAAIRLDPPGAVSRQMLLTGGAMLAGLVLLWILLRGARGRRRRGGAALQRDVISTAWKKAMAAPELHPAGGPPSRAVPPRPRAAEPQQEAGPMASTVAAAAPRTAAVAAAEAASDAEDLLQAARNLVGRPAPERKGLRRTLRADGRFGA